MGAGVFGTYDGEEDIVGLTLNSSPWLPSLCLFTFLFLFHYIFSTIAANIQGTRIYIYIYIWVEWSMLKINSQQYFMA